MSLTEVNSKFPRVKLNKPVEKRDLINFIQSRSGYVSSDVVGMMYEFCDSILFFLKQATPVRLEGIGIFSPSLKLDGTIQIKFRPDKSLVRELNTSNSLKGHITNRHNIGKSLDDLAEDSVTNRNG